MTSEETEGDRVLVSRESIILDSLHLIVLPGDAERDGPGLDTIETWVFILVGADEGVEILDSETWIEQDLRVATELLSHETAQ